MKKLLNGELIDMTTEEIAALQPSILSLQNTKIAMINQWRADQEVATVDYIGHTWQADSVSREKLSLTLAAYPTELPVGFFWTSNSNQDVTVTRAELEGLLQAIVAQGFAIHQRQRQMKQDISSLDAAQDILDYPIGW